MRLINQTRGIVLAQDIVFANTPLKRVIGLLGHKNLLDGQALVIEPCNSIHTLFMRFSIDVLFVDKNNKVVKALEQLSPFRVSKLYCKSSMVVELPCGKLKSTQTQDGDSLQFLD